MSGGGDAVARLILFILSLELCYIDGFDIDTRNLNASSLSSVATIKSRTESEENTFVGSAVHPKTSAPLAVQLQFQLDAAQCSPIPGIRESAEIAATPTRRERNTSISTASSSASSTSTRRTARPMPDLNAFDGEGCLPFRDRSSDDSAISSGKSHPSSPKLLCPPTPVRTPAWAHTGADGHPLFKHGRRPPIGRSDSLNVTKVLATYEMPSFRRSYFEHELSNTERPEKASEDCSTMHLRKQTGFPLVNAPRLQVQQKERALFRNEAAAPSEAFDVISLLGSGTFGDVYKARSRADGGLYALKRSRRQFRGKRDRDRAMQEVHHMQHLQNSATTVCPYMLLFFQAWQQDGYFFCLTELCSRATCRTLIDIFRSQNCLTFRSYPSIARLPESMMCPVGASSSTCTRLIPERTIWKICHDICAGLRHIHEQGLVHNDIKPSNIFLVCDEQLGALCKIGDFGMTRAIGSRDDGEEGDQQYLAMEVLHSGKKDTSADMFSLGVSLYELSASLSFELPADGQRWHDLRKGHNVLKDIPAYRSAELKRLLVSMMDSNPGNRPLARVLLGSEIVASCSSDTFLRDFIRDIERCDKLEEDRKAACTEQTPRNGAPSRTRSCSPSIGNLPGALIYSPETALS